MKRCICCKRAFEKEVECYKIISHKDGVKREYCDFCAVMKFINLGFWARFDWTNKQLAEAVEKFNGIAFNMYLAKKRKEIVLSEVNKDGSV